MVYIQTATALTPVYRAVHHLQTHAIVDLCIGGVCTSDFHQWHHKLETVLKEIQESSGNLLSDLKSSVLKELPDREKLEKAIALVDEQEAVLGKLETLTAENSSLRKKVGQLSKAREPKTEEVPAAVASLPSGMVEKPPLSDRLNDNSSDSSIKSHEQAIEEIVRLKERGLEPNEIARELTGRYYTSKEKTNWRGIQVERILAKN